MSTVSIENEETLLSKIVGILKSLLPDFKNISLVNNILIPLGSIIAFLVLWHLGSTSLYNAEAGDRIAVALKSGGEKEAASVTALIESAKSKINGSYAEFTSLTPMEKKNIPNTLPTPLVVKNAAIGLWKDHLIVKADKAAFITKTAALNKKLKAQGKTVMTYTGRPSFIDQVKTSLKTVFAGVLIALLVAVPTGIVVGLNDKLKSSFNWIIQIFKPVSPVVWFLLVFMVVKTVLRNSDMDKSFVISMIAVGLCSMWATLVNTSMGVSSVDKDYMNVANVLRLNFFNKVFKIVLPSALPLIFTGLRITVSVAWMVLIAIELLAQSPGLGLFVWEEFQNGATDSNAKIIVAMFLIGLIGFMLDRIMLSVQKLLSFA